MKFVWDEKKEIANARKHHVGFSEACLVFADQYMLNLSDREHSKEEERWVSIGQTPDGNILTVVHTFRDIGDVELVRIISARRATKKEADNYFKRRL